MSAGTCNNIDDCIDYGCCDCLENRFKDDIIDAYYSKIPRWLTNSINQNNKCFRILVENRNWGVNKKNTILILIDVITYLYKNSNQFFYHSDSKKIKRTIKNLAFLIRESHVNVNKIPPYLFEEDYEKKVFNLDCTFTNMTLDTFKMWRWNMNEKPNPIILLLQENILKFDEIDEKWLNREESQILPSEIIDLIEKYASLDESDKHHGYD